MQEQDVILNEISNFLCARHTRVRMRGEHFLFYILFMVVGCAFFQGRWRASRFFGGDRSGGALGSGEARGSSGAATARASGSFTCHTLCHFAGIETPSGQF